MTEILSFSHLKRFLGISIFCLLALQGGIALGQNVSIVSTPNTACNGLPCDWQGPTIMINEIMISPTTGDGSLVGPGPNGGRGEWIELYNPDVCNPVDISCYYLGNFTFEGSGGFRLPDNLIVPPAGFVVLRGFDAPPVPAANLIANGGNVIEIVAPQQINAIGVCVVGNPGNRLWFPNAGGWFAFYDENGVPQDAISWGSPVASDLAGNPCVPVRPGCGIAQSLPSYNQIPAQNKTYGSPANANNHLGLSIRRIPDGGPWSGVGAATYANCNAPCFNPGQSTCTGTATVMSAPGNPPYTYQWNDPDNQTTQNAIGLCEGTHTVTVTSSNGIVSTGTVTISNYVPNVSFNMSANMCVNAPPVQLTGFSPVPTNNQQGVFNGPGVNQGQFNPTNAGPGVHNVTYTFTDQSGCTNNAQATLTVFPLPTLTINAPNTICINAPPIQVNLNPAGGTLSGPGVTGNTFNPATAGLGTHTLTYNFTDGNGCSNTITKPITVNPLPQITINTAASVCINENPITLSGMPANGVFTLNGNTITTFNPSALGPGTYNLTYSATDNNGCANSQNFTITVHPLPTVSFEINDDLCLNSAFYPFTDFQVSPTGGTVTFSGPGVQNGGISAANAGEGVHNIVLNYTDLNGCQNSANANVTVFGLPQISIFGNNEQYCVTDSITNFSFDPDSGTLFGPSTDNNQFFPSQNAPGFYNLGYVYIDPNGCSDTLNFTVEVTPLPVVQILTPPYVCVNAATFTIPTNPANAGNITVNAVPSTTINPSELGVGVHQLFFEYTDPIGCYNSTTKLLYVAPIPDISVDLKPVVDCPPLSYVFSGEFANGESCVWDFGDGNSAITCDPVTHTYLETGCYSPTFTVFNEFGCFNDTLLFQHICVHPVPLAAFAYGPTELTIYQSTTQFINLSAGATDYIWDFNINGDIQSTQAENPSFTFPLGAVGFYPVTLYAISEDGCVDSTTMVINIEADVLLYVPNTFTPDNDNFNELWRVYAEGIDIYTFHLQVFNRWGELIWESFNAEAGWNGTYGGKVVPDGTYVWKLSAKHLFKDRRQTWSGHVNVLR